MLGSLVAEILYGYTVIVSFIDESSVHSDNGNYANCSTARTCFVRSRSVDASWVPPTVDYPLNSKHTLIIDGYIR